MLQSLHDTYKYLWTVVVPCNSPNNLQIFINLSSSRVESSVSSYCLLLASVHTNIERHPPVHLQYAGII